MDNDNKVTKSPAPSMLGKETSLFLAEHLSKLPSERKVYNLDEEFAKTKRNRSPIVPLVIIGMVIVFGAVAFLITRSINSDIRKTPVDIQAFDDVNLRDLLDTAKKNQQDQDRIQRDIAALKDDFRNELSGIEADRRSELELNASQRISAAGVATRNAATNHKADERSAAVRAKYDKLIAAKKKESDEVQKRIDAYDTRAMERAKQQQEVLDNQQRVFDIEQSKTKTYYESRIADLEAASRHELSSAERKKEELVKSLKASHAAEVAELIAKYNPTFTDDRTAALLKAEVAGHYAPAEFPAILAEEKVMTREDFDAQTQALDELLYLSGKLQTVPYINSVPGSLAGIAGRATAAASSYQTALGASATTLAAKNETIREQSAQIATRDETIRDQLAQLAAKDETIRDQTAQLSARDETINDQTNQLSARDETIRDQSGQLDVAHALLGSYDYAFTAYTSNLKQVGLILDPRNPESLVVFLSPGSAVPDGATTAWIYRNNEFIGSILLTKEGTTVSAAMQELARGKTLGAFDRILLKKR